VYAELPAHRLLELHRRAGAALEAAHAARPEIAAALAMHFRIAGQDERALRYARQAGDHAAQQFAHAEAAQHYATAIDLLLRAGDEADAARVRERQALELIDAHRATEALATLNEALDTYRRRGDAFGQARVHFLLARVHQFGFDYRTAQPLLEAALRLWPADQQLTAEYAALVLDAARARTFTADHARARVFAERALELCERLGDAGLLARALTEVELVRQHDGAPASECAPLLDRAEALARAARHWRTVGRVHMNRGSRKEAAGDLRRSREERGLAVTAWERGGAVWSTAWGGYVLATVCIELGDWHAARQALAVARDNVPTFPGLDVLSAWLDGEHRLALELIPRLIDDARRRNDAQAVHAALLMQADFALQLGQTELAERGARAAAELPVVELSVAQTTRAVLAEAVVGRSAPDAHHVLAEAARADTAELAGDRPRFLRARARFLVARGDLDAAQASILSSAELARAQGAVVQLARTLLVAADISHARHDSPALAAADAERAAIVRRIGPAARGLSWAASARRDADVPQLLTRRELEVAQLVARGLTNAQIARELVVTERTVAAHIEHIHAKLGFSSRTQIGVWAATSAGLPIHADIGDNTDAPVSRRP
jgi:DNA-binding CsgD family transcriptional regulator/tetratricopeptide (TPR) repeat protein